MTKEQFTAQVLECEDMLYKVAMGMLRNDADAEDAIQTAILRAFEKLPSLKDDAYFCTWLTRILINVCKSQLRQQKPTEPLAGQTEKTSASPQEEVEVRAAVEALPLKLRQVTILYYSLDFTTPEIAAILRIPKGTVLSRLDKARRLLRLELE